MFEREKDKNDRFRSTLRVKSIYSMTTLIARERERKIYIEKKISLEKVHCSFIGLMDHLHLDLRSTFPRYILEYSILDDDKD